MKDILRNILPVPNKKSVFFSNLLKKKITNKIDASIDKCISFSDYLNFALYDRKYGYYNNKLKKFGINGDFITSPEISSCFGKCIAFHFSKKMGYKYSILEIGAGTGKLAIDIIEELSNLNIKINKYFILEISAELRNKQINKILNHSKKVYSQVEWILDFPQDFKGIILGNELLDAIPFNLIQIKKDIIYEMLVTHDDGKLLYKRMKSNNVQLESEVRKQVPRYILQSKDFYQFELNLLIAPLINSINICLKEGYIFFIDYGFLQNEHFHNL